MNLDTAEERHAIRELIARFYRAISGPAGAPRAWSDLDAAYVADARISPFHVDERGDVRFEVMTPAQYRASREPLFVTQSFYEEETAHDVQIRGRIAHVFSDYQARRDPQQAPFTWGVNSIQLVRTHEGWKITAITWEFTGLADKKS